MFFLNGVLLLIDSFQQRWTIGVVENSAPTDFEWSIHCLNSNRRGSCCTCTMKLQVLNMNSLLKALTLKAHIYSVIFVSIDQD